MGLFDDSLPDGWGRLLVDRHAAKLGFSPRALGPLDRLALVGHESLGALEYEPEYDRILPSVIDLAEIEADTQRVLSGVEPADLDRLIALASSPQGARPKILVHEAPDGRLMAGAGDLAPGHRAYLVKFRSPLDAKESANLEHAYFLMAEAAGIDVPATKVMGGNRRRSGYFAIERFDRLPGRRIHQHTVGGLLELPHGYTAFDYKDLLLLTRSLTRSEQATTEMYRRACFNVLAHNRDDHVRNFAFLMNESGTWRLSPAYDLTFSAGPGGEHSTLILGEGHRPDATHLRALARELGVKRYAQVIDHVEAAVADFDTWAQKARVPKKLRRSVFQTLQKGRARSNRSA